MAKCGHHAALVGVCVSHRIHSDCVNEKEKDYRCIEGLMRDVFIPLEMQ